MTKRGAVFGVTEHVLHPYEQLAGVYRRKGDEQAARTVSIGKQRARRAAYARWWVRWPSVGWSAVLRWSIGYGYRPGRALIPLLVLVPAGSVLFLIASHYPNQLHPAKPGSLEQLGFNSFRYTMDLLLPVVYRRLGRCPRPSGPAEGSCERAVRMTPPG